MKPIMLILLMAALTMTVNPLAPEHTSHAGAVQDTSKVTQKTETQTTVVERPVTRCADAETDDGRLPGSITGPRLSGKNTNNLIIIL